MTKTSKQIRPAALAAVFAAALGALGSPVWAGVSAVPASPGRPGAFCGCETVVQKDGKFIPEFSMYVYLPVTTGRECARQCGRRAFPAGKSHPLALIYHALGIGNDSGSYGELGRHLASHGFVVASLEHTTQLDEAIPFLHDIYGAALSDDVVLVGHSAGGDLMVQRAHDVPNLGLNLRAMVLMAPRTKDSTDYALPDTDSMLGLHWSRDNDSATYGAPGTPALRSVFKIYDRAGVVWNDPNRLTLYKDLVFFDFPFAGHYQQGQLGIIAYTTAFLRRYVYGELGQDAYLKRMQPIENLFGSDLPVSQLHAEPARLAVANFEEVQQSIPDVFDDVFTPGVTAAPPWPSWTDPFSPHDTGVLEFHLQPQAAKRQVAILTKEYVNVSQYKHLSFRIGQRYHDTLNPAGSNVDFRIEIQTSGEESAVWASAYHPLRFPMVVENLPIPPAYHTVNATKNAMRTYVIPLSDFAINDWTDVGAVVFDFSHLPAGELRFVLDDVEFLP
jgi:hypothetical protein